MAGIPHAGKGKDRGQLALHTLQALAPILGEDALSELWAAVIPRLLTYLEGVYTQRVQKLSSAFVAMIEEKSS